MESGAETLTPPREPDQFQKTHFAVTAELLGIFVLRVPGSTKPKQYYNQSLIFFHLWECNWRSPSFAKYTLRGPQDGTELWSLILNYPWRVLANSEQTNHHNANRSLRGAVFQPQKRFPAKSHDQVLVQRGNPSQGATGGEAHALGKATLASSPASAPQTSQSGSARALFPLLQKPKVLKTEI